MKINFPKIVSYVCLTIIGIVFLVFIAWIFTPKIDLDRRRKEDKNFAKSMQLYLLAKAYKHQSALYADSAVNYSGPEVKDRIQIWIKGAKVDDSLYNAYADSAKALLTK